MDFTGTWKVTDVTHDVGNIGVVVWPPIQSRFNIDKTTTGYLLCTKCWMDWGPDAIVLMLISEDHDKIDFTGTVKIDGDDHPLTLKGYKGIGGQNGGDKFEFEVFGNARGTGGAGRG